jgi:hypothetical protein
MEYNQDEVEDEYYSDDPVVDPKIDWYYKLRSFAPVAILLLVTTIYLPSTVGGKISLNSGSAKFEFGKGVIQAPTCAEGKQLSLSLSAKFDNASNKFLLSALTLGELPSNCQGKDLVISLYSNSTGSVPTPFFNGTNSKLYVFMNFGPNFERGYLGSGMSLSNLSSNSFTASVSTPFADATKIDKITVESSEHRIWPCNLLGPCFVGDTGPGSGTIFYVDMNGFSCGKLLNQTCTYLEYAPRDASNGSVWTPGGVVVAGVETATTSTDAFVKSKIGYGGSNTRIITDLAGSCPTPGSQTNCSAAYTASRYVESGNALTDWFLPNFAELNELCKFVNNIRGTAVTVACTPTNTSLGPAKGFGTGAGNAWLSSTAGVDYRSPWAIKFNDSNLANTFFKGNPTNWGTGAQRVRSIRAF